MTLPQVPLPAGIKAISSKRPMPVQGDNWTPFEDELKPAENPDTSETPETHIVYFIANSEKNLESSLKEPVYVAPIPATAGIPKRVQAYAHTVDFGNSEIPIHRGISTFKLDPKPIPATSIDPSRLKALEKAVNTAKPMGAK